MMATGACRAEELLRASCCSRLVADDDELHSPTDASEDSVEVKVLPILALSKKNKRKLAEPRKVPPDGKVTPAAKRSRRAAPRGVTDLVTTPAPSPFRPWSESNKPVPANDEPLSLVLRPSVTDSPSPALCGGKPTCESVERRRTSSKFSVESLLGAESVSGGEGLAPPRAPSTAGSSRNTSGQHPVQRNYKNMTRERRIEANARERTRVHTISAAFDTLRRSIPAYSHSQKLSKLSILRIACSYIVALSRVNGMDYSEGQTAPSIAECVDLVSKTLHAEGKVRKKKDE